jgi:hypothetical protein
VAEPVPAVCAGTVALAPPVLLLIRKPAVLKVVLQLLAALQLLPLGQHWAALAAVVCALASVTAAVVPLLAVG